MTTTEQEIDAMSGPQLERLIAETQGWHLHPFTHCWYDPDGEWTYDEPPKVTSDPAAAWELQTWLLRQDWCSRLLMAHGLGAYQAIICDAIDSERFWQAIEQTPELAQARATAKCLVALQKEKGD